MQGQIVEMGLDARTAVHLHRPRAGAGGERSDVSGGFAPDGVLIFGVGGADGDRARGAAVDAPGERVGVGQSGRGKGISQLHRARSVDAGEGVGALGAVGEVVGRNKAVTHMIHGILVALDELVAHRRSDGGRRRRTGLYSSNTPGCSRAAVGRHIAQEVASLAGVGVEHALRTAPRHQAVTPEEQTAIGGLIERYLGKVVHVGVGVERSALEMAAVAVKTNAGNVGETGLLDE